MDNPHDDTPDSKLELKLIYDIPAPLHAKIMAWCEATKGFRYLVINLVKHELYRTPDVQAKY